MNRYPTYKPIELPWLSEIPAHWSVLRNKNIFSEVKDTVGSDSRTYTLLSLTLNGIIPRDVESGKGKTKWQCAGRLWKGHLAGVIQPFDRGLWQRLFCADIAANEKILYNVSKYERTAFAFDLDALPPPFVGGKQTGKAVVYERSHRLRVVKPSTGAANLHDVL